MGYVPTPGPGQILVKTEACGVCHTDLHAANGDWPLKPTPPFIPGHEAIGLVVAIGAGVDARQGRRPGRRALALFGLRPLRILPVGLGDGLRTRRSSAATPRTAASPTTLLADPDYVAHIPDGTSVRSEAAPLICAGVTTYKGIKETDVPSPANGSPSPAAAAWAIWPFNTPRRWACTSAAVDIDDGKLEHAKRLGAELTVNAKTADPAAVLKAHIGGGAHGVLITAPSLPAFKQGVGMTRKTGACVLVGLPPGEFPTPLFDVVANCITIRGSFVGTREDMAEALAFAAAGQVKADIELQPLSGINDVFERLERGDVPSRVVLDFTHATRESAASTAKNASRKVVHA